MDEREDDDLPPFRRPRRIEVTLAADGRYVVASLGGGMPVAIRLDREEAEATLAALRALLKGAEG